MSTEKLVKAPSGRVKRKPLERRNRLNVKGKDPNYVYRIVNDTEDRIEDFKDRGWIVDTSDEVRVGGGRVNDASSVGKARVISVGQGTKAVLMKIQREFYEEDQEAKNEYIDKTEEAMRPNPNDGTYGKIELTRK